jgi:hypothetical protein
MLRKKYLIVVLLISIVLFDLSAIVFNKSPFEVSNSSFTEKGNKVILGQNSEALLVAFQGNDSKIYLSSSSDGYNFSTNKIATIDKGMLQAMAVKDDLVVVGYADAGKIFTVTSLDGGKTFKSPTTLTPTRQDSTINGIVIDEKDIVHLLFHRHDRFWDYNYSHSIDKGSTYTTKLKFTGSTDSNSTGYSASLISQHNNLYTVYQDNNDRFAIKLGISKDSGSTWRIHRINSSKGGKLSFAVDPNDPDLVYIGSFTADGVVIYKIENATKPVFTTTVLYTDSSLKPTANSVVSINVAISDDNEISVVLLNPITGMYELLTSRDGGQMWFTEDMQTTIPLKNFEWIGDLKSFNNNLIFARHDGKGKILLHGDNLSPIGPIYRANELGFVLVNNINKPFKVAVEQEYTWLFFSISKAGKYKITNLTHQDSPLFFALTNYNLKDELFIGDNWPELELEDHFNVTLEADDNYMLALISLAEEQSDEIVTFEIVPIN